MSRNQRRRRNERRSPPQPSRARSSTETETSLQRPQPHTLARHTTHKRYYTHTGPSEKQEKSKRKARERERKSFWNRKRWGDVRMGGAESVQVFQRNSAPWLLSSLVRDRADWSQMALSKLGLGGGGCVSALCVLNTPAAFGQRNPSRPGSSLFSPLFSDHFAYLLSRPCRPPSVLSTREKPARRWPFLKN